MALCQDFVGYHHENNCKVHNTKPHQMRHIIDILINNDNDLFSALSLEPRGAMRWESLLSVKPKNIHELFSPSELQLTNTKAHTLLHAENTQK